MSACVRVCELQPQLQPQLQLQASAAASACTPAPDPEHQHQPAPAPKRVTFAPLPRKRKRKSEDCESLENLQVQLMRLHRRLKRVSKREREHTDREVRRHEDTTESLAQLRLRVDQLMQQLIVLTIRFNSLIERLGE